MKITKLAFRNISQNFKKYAMFFFSLCFSVFSTYSFLALMRNEYVSYAFKNDQRYTSLLMSFAVIILVFVVFYLLSSNNSFIRARKKEISTYSLFGMSNGRIGILLFFETMLIGTAAIALGIVAGMIFSKLLAMILLDMALASYAGEIKFTVDIYSALVTAVIFMLAFCLMGLSGRRVIAKFELIDLFKAEKVSEGRIKGSVILLILSILLVSAGYCLALSENPMVVVVSVLAILGLTIGGTYLFFRGGMPKILQIIKSSKDDYYKAEKLISVAAFSHRMKSITATMATIAVLSAVATTAVATGYTLYTSAEANAYEQTGFDMYFINGRGVTLSQVEDIFRKYDNKITDVYEFDRAYVKTTVENGNDAYISSGERSFRIYSESTYNEILKLARIKHDYLSVEDGKFMLLDTFLASIQKKDAEGMVIRLSDGTALSLSQLYRRQGFSYDLGQTVIVSDNDFAKLDAAGVIIRYDESSNLNRATAINYTGALNSGDIYKELSELIPSDTGKFVYWIYAESLSVFGLICFIGFFMSVIFILMTASMLYFKQVIAAEDEKKQFQTLRKIGLDAQTQKKVVTNRLLPVFIVPLIIGIVHSAFAMKAADTIVFSNMISVDNSYLRVLALSGVMYIVYTLVYMVFYLVTKAQYSRIINSN